jgi:hypothetical protein
MPVWTKMKNGEYIVVYEICGPEKCNIYYKKSKDGVTWPAGLGAPIPDQLGGPYVLSLPNGNLLVTSNSSNISLSKDYGLHWQTINAAFSRSLWPAMYAFGDNEVGVVSAQKREEGGNSVHLKFGKYSFKQ